MSSVVSSSTTGVASGPRSTPAGLEPHNKSGGFITAPGLQPLVTVKVSAEQRAITHMAASLLLDYPGADLLAQTQQLRAGLVGLPEPLFQRLSGFVDYLEQTPERWLNQHYVDTFDLKRKCSMYLSYFLTGDTRKRGTALVRFVEAYRAVGFEVDRAELPDFLPIVLEFSARASGSPGGNEIASGLLNAHRQGIEVLRSSLTALGSPYAALVEAVCQTLPPISEKVRDRYLELITAGPPTEMVGLSALGPLEPYSAGVEDSEARR